MNNIIFSVVEKNESGNFLCEYFGDSREDAVKRFNNKCEIMGQDLAGWQKEIRDNSCIWQNGNEMRMLEIVEKNIL